MTSPAELRAGIAEAVRGLDDAALLELVDASKLTRAVEERLSAPTPERPRRRIVHRTQPEAPPAARNVVPAQSQRSDDVPEPAESAEPKPLRAGPPCKTCSHPDVALIHSALEAGESVRSVAARFGLNHATLTAHRRRHTTIPARPRSVKGQRRERVRVEYLTREDVPLEGERGERLPWPRLAADGVTPLGIRLDAPGKRQATIAEDIRGLVINRLNGRAATLDADDVVADVYRRILERNTMPSAYDPRLGAVSKYTHNITTCAIADALKAQDRHPVGADEDEALEAVAADDDEPFFDADAVPLDFDERERFFLTALCIELFGEAPERRQLWEIAAEQRRAEQARERGEREEPAPAEPPKPPGRGYRRRDGAIEQELLTLIRSARGPITRAELARKLGKSVAVITKPMQRIEASGAVKVLRVDNPGMGKGSLLAYLVDVQGSPESEATPAPTQPEDAPTPPAEALPEEPEATVEMISMVEDDGPPTERGTAWGFEEQAPPRPRRTLRGRGLVDPERVRAALS